MIKVLLTSMIIVCSISVMGQTNEASTSSNINAFKNNNTTYNHSDGYMGYREQILKRLIVKEIPASFPKPAIGQTREEYKEIILDWGRNNLHMVKEEYHSELN